MGLLRITIQRKEIQIRTQEKEELRKLKSNSGIPGLLCVNNLLYSHEKNQQNT
jgi:hypothetical protein